MQLFLGLVVLFFGTINCYIVDPGPTIKATKGKVWPMPQSQLSVYYFLVVQPFMFEFTVTNYTCDPLQSALNRYEKIIVNSASLERRGRLAEVASIKQLREKKLWRLEDDFQGYLTGLNVTLTYPCEDNEYPSLQMSENYTLKVSPENSELISDTVWGIMRGLETFSQLIHMSDDYSYQRINVTAIDDFPRFPHRGLLLDTSRHFIPLYAIFETLDAMSYNKMNVFHWHLTDDQSFPYKSKKFPELSQKGAYHPVSRVYEPEDVQSVIEYARVRGIRVIPEFDTPGHTRSWGEGIPGLLTPCYNGTEPTGHFGPIDPSKDSTYDFLEKFFGEIVEVFPDSYVHLGGDEVGFECWESNPDINAFMDKINITGDYAALESYYIQKLINIADKLNASSVVWQEVFVNGVELPDETVVHVWIETNFTDVINNVTKSGKPVLLSACWYLDHLSSGGDWWKYYQCEPYDFPGTDEQKKLLMGGEAAMWAEVVNEFNVMSRVWPRAAAVAEKLWSMESSEDQLRVAERIEEHTCRLNHRGIHAQPPNSAGVCL